MKSLNTAQTKTVVELYAAGVGTIHGFAAICDVPIARIKKTLDQYGVPHNKHTRNRNLAPDEIIELVKKGE